MNSRPSWTDEEEYKLTPEILQSPAELERWFGRIYARRCLISLLNMSLFDYSYFVYRKGDFNLLLSGFFIEPYPSRIYMLRDGTEVTVKKTSFYGMFDQPDYEDINGNYWNSRGKYLGSSKSEIWGYRSNKYYEPHPKDIVNEKEGKGWLVYLSLFFGWANPVDLHFIED